MTPGGELEALVNSMAPWQRDMYEQAVVAMDNGRTILFHGGRQMGRTTVKRALELRAREQEAT